jgi:hypothetical protein
MRIKNLITYSSPGFGGTNSLCNAMVDAENLRLVLANGSPQEELRTGP